MKIKMERWAPVGMDGGREAKWILAGLGLGALAAVINFMGRYSDALNKLYRGMVSPSSLYSGRASEAYLIPGAVIDPFSEIVLGCETVFVLVCLMMPLLAVYHYAVHWRGSKSIYLMRRLPSRWELHRRCLTIPAVGMVSALAVLGLLGILFYCVYRFCTPGQCLPG